MATNYFSFLLSLFVALGALNVSDQYSSAVESYLHLRKGIYVDAKSTVTQFCLEKFRNIDRPEKPNSIFTFSISWRVQGNFESVCSTQTSDRHFPRRHYHIGATTQFRLGGHNFNFPEIYSSFLR